MDGHEQIFRALTAVLRRDRRGLDLRDEYLGAKASTQKPALHLYGKQPVAIFAGRKPQPTYVAGVIRQRRFVGFHFMPMYSHPRLFSVAHAGLKRMVKGKSCINVTRLDADMLDELEALLARGIAHYRQLGWL
jgi:hypothetical protein